jgi:integrase
MTLSSSGLSGRGRAESQDRKPKPTSAFLSASLAARTEMSCWQPSTPSTLRRPDKERTKPKPFTEAELKKLLAQVPKTFPDPKKAPRLTTLIHVMVSTGLAIRDTVQLEHRHIQRRCHWQIESGRGGMGMCRSGSASFQRDRRSGSLRVFPVWRNARAPDQGRPTKIHVKDCRTPMPADIPRWLPIR